MEIDDAAPPHLKDQTSSFVGFEVGMTSTKDVLRIFSQFSMLWGPLIAFSRIIKVEGGD